MPYINIDYTVPATQHAFPALSQVFIKSVSQPSFCLHSLLPTANKIPHPQPYQKIPDIFISYAVAHYHIS